MKSRHNIKEIINSAVQAARAEGLIKIGTLPDIVIEKSRKDEFGDFATNIAMVLAPLEKRPPREVAAIIAAKIQDAKETTGVPLVKKCEVAGPGFINIFLMETYWLSILRDILDKGEAFGRSEAGAGKKVLLEFVSANPTGPLHIGHGRGAAVGDATARIMAAAGYAVTKEFYINDIGKQVLTLGRSVYIRYLQLLGKKIELPEDSYKGEYIKDVAIEFRKENGDNFNNGILDIQGNNRQIELLQPFIDFAKKRLLDDIKTDLAAFGVAFDNWFSEASLYKPENIVDKAIETLKKDGFAREEDGALWLKTMELANDDKDRVLVKADGSKTYLASDVAYHNEKAKRGFDILINVWGADHHGYEARIRAALKAFGHDPTILKIIFIQLVALLRNGAPVAMGKREGEFVTLRQVMDEVGADACRFFFLMRKADAQLDFDLELAKSQAPENPVYYVQYCHARIRSIIDYAKEQGVNVPADTEDEALALLTSKDDIDLIKHLALFEEVVEKSALAMEPHRVTYYLTELAGIFHPYYNRNRIVTDDAGLTAGRLLLCTATAQVIKNGLGLLGVSAPDKM
ncbi:MAG: arginine--tRNA ligase [Deltaproteobacteria bacterium]|nr:arginine--tRNA ligase [Deltaproteobacteria bacterium]